MKSNKCEENEIRDSSYLVNHVLLHHHRLLHHLHRQLSLLLVLPVAKEDLAKGASRDWLQDLKVFNGRSYAGAGGGPGWPAKDKGKICYSK